MKFVSFFYSIQTFSRTKKHSDSLMLLEILKAFRLKKKGY